MYDEIKYCKFCDKEKPIKEFCRSGGFIKNICKECQNKKQKEIYANSKKVNEKDKEIERLNNIINELEKNIENDNCLYKEEKEYIKEEAMYSDEWKSCCDDLYCKDCDKLLEILEKVEESK